MRKKRRKESGVVADINQWVHAIFLQKNKTIQEEEVLEEVLTRGGDSHQRRRCKRSMESRELVEEGSMLNAATLPTDCCVS